MRQILKDELIYKFVIIPPLEFAFLKCFLLPGVYYLQRLGVNQSSCWATNICTNRNSSSLLVSSCAVHGGTYIFIRVRRSPIVSCVLRRNPLSPVPFALCPISKIYQYSSIFPLSESGGGWSGFYIS